MAKTKLKAVRDTTHLRVKQKTFDMISGLAQSWGRQNLEITHMAIMTLLYVNSPDQLANLLIDLVDDPAAVRELMKKQTPEGLQRVRERLTNYYNDDTIWSFIPRKENKRK